MTRRGARRAVVAALLAGALLSAAGCADPAADDVVVEFTVANGETFKVLLTDQEEIQIANDLIAGEDVPSIPNGRVVRETGVNEGYTWSIDPADFEFAEVTIEVCDGSPSDVEQGLVTSDRYCPWSAIISDIGPAPTPRPRPDHGPRPASQGRATNQPRRSSSQRSKRRPAPTSRASSASWSSRSGRERLDPGPVTEVVADLRVEDIVGHDGARHGDPDRPDLGPPSGRPGPVHARRVHLGDDQAVRTQVPARDLERGRAEVVVVDEVAGQQRDVERGRIRASGRRSRRRPARCPGRPPARPASPARGRPPRPCGQGRRGRARTGPSRRRGRGCASPRGSPHGWCPPLPAAAGPGRSRPGCRRARRRRP